MTQTAFCYTYLINLAEGFWDEAFYCQSRLQLFKVCYPTNDTYVTALVAKGAFYNPN